MAQRAHRLAHTSTNRMHRTDRRTRLPTVSVRHGIPYPRTLSVRHRHCTRPSRTCESSTRRFRAGAESLRFSLANVRFAPSTARPPLCDRSSWSPSTGPTREHPRRRNHPGPRQAPSPRDQHSEAGPLFPIPFSLESDWEFRWGPAVDGHRPCEAEKHLNWRNPFVTIAPPRTRNRARWPRPGPLRAMLRAGPMSGPPRDAGVATGKNRHDKSGKDVGFRRLWKNWKPTLNHLHWPRPSARTGAARVLWLRCCRASSMNHNPLIPQSFFYQAAKSRTKEPR